MDFIATERQDIGNVDFAHLNAGNIDAGALAGAYEA